MMTNERYWQLQNSDTLNTTLEEKSEGWHFCEEFDGLLTQGEQIDDEGRCAFCEFDRRLV